MYDETFQILLAFAQGLGFSIGIGTALYKSIEHLVSNITEQFDHKMMEFMKIVNEETDDIKEDLRSEHQQMSRKLERVIEEVC